MKQIGLCGVKEVVPCKEVVRNEALEWIKRVMTQKDVVSK